MDSKRKKKKAKTDQNSSTSRALKFEHHNTAFGKGI